jgi:hypothetical protein
VRSRVRAQLGRLLFAATPLTVAPLGAQVSAAADLGGVVHRSGADLWRSTSRVDPAFRADGRWAQASVDADVWGGADGLRLQRGTADLLAAPAPFGPFRFTVTAHAERTAMSPFLERTAQTAGTLESALSLRIGGGGGWLGLGAERGSAIDSMSARPLLRAGLWHRFGLTTVSLSAESHRARLGGRPPTLHYYTLSPDSSRDSVSGAWIVNGPHVLAIPDSGSPSRPWQWSDLQARVGWSAGRVSLDGRVGVQPKVDIAPRSLWARGVATIGLAPRLSLIAGGGVQPSAIWLGAPSSRFLSFGLRVAPASLVHPAPPPYVRPSAASFVIRHADGDTTATSYVVAVRVPDARAVEISGDFNGWHPLPLREARPGVWETTLSLLPGTHRVNLRLNGDRWVAPPGLPTTDDDFNGTVGLVVVR